MESLFIRRISRNRGNMKKIIPIAAVAVLSLGGFAIKASAHDPEERIDQQRTDETVYEDRGPRFDDRGQWRRKDPDPLGGLNREVEHLNRMIDHFSAELRASRADRRLWYRYRPIRDEADRLNDLFR